MEYLWIFLLFFAVLAAAWFYLQRAKARPTATATTTTTTTTDTPADTTDATDATDATDERSAS